MIPIGARVQVTKLDPIPIDPTLAAVPADDSPDQSAPVEIGETGTVDYWDSSPSSLHPNHVQFDSGHGEFYADDELTVTG